MSLSVQVQQTRGKIRPVHPKEKPKGHWDREALQICDSYAIWTSSNNDGSPWSAQERTAIARMEQYVNDYFLGPEYSDVDVRHMLRNATREGRNFFEVFSVKEKGENLVASKLRWDDCQRRRKRQEEKAWKESQGLEEEDKRKWFAAYEDAAKKMLKYLEVSEDLKESQRELKEQCNLQKKQVFLSCRLPNRQGMREAKSSSRSSGDKRTRCASPVRRGRIHN